MPGACIEVEEDGPDVVYAVDLTAGARLSVRGQASASDIALYLLGPGSPTICDATASHCVRGVEATGYGEAEVLDYTATAAGTYYLVVDSFTPMRFGDFTLDVSLTR